MNKETKLEIGKKIISHVESMFPNHKEIEYGVEFDTGSFKAAIFWKLNNDKYSRRIIIVITEEALECLSVDGKALERFCQYINNQYKNFNPNHDNTIDQPPPIEKWNVNSSI